MVTVVNVETPRNCCFLISVSPFPSVIFSSEVQPSKGSSPRLVTLSGIVISLSELQVTKA